MRRTVRCRSSNPAPILLHLAEKAGRFMPTDPRGRKEMMEWLFWQVGNLGPMAGQLSHFVNYAQGEHAYSKQRYANEYNRCLGVLERRLAGRDYILDDVFHRRHHLVALGADRQAARPAAGRIPQRFPLARRDQAAAGGAARGGSGEGVAPPGAALRGRAAAAVQPDGAQRGRGGAMSGQALYGKA